MGAANPRPRRGGRPRSRGGSGCRGLSIATVTGDDVLELVDGGDYVDRRDRGAGRGARRSLSRPTRTSARSRSSRRSPQGADVVITGPRRGSVAVRRAAGVTSSAGRSTTWPELGRGTLVGHLLECAGQVTGGYFADPGLQGRRGSEPARIPDRRGARDRAGRHHQGARIRRRVTAATCKEQLLYEIHDPAAYVTPERGRGLQPRPDHGAGAGSRRRRRRDRRPRPESLKVSLGYRDGYIGEGADLVCRRRRGRPRAGSPARIVAERLRRTGRSPRTTSGRDLIGVNALHGARISSATRSRYEVRLRVAARTPTIARSPDESATKSRRCTRTARPAAAARRNATREVLSMCVDVRAARARLVRGQLRGASDMKLRAIAPLPQRRQGRRSLNISLIAFDERDYPRLVRARHGRPRQGTVRRSRRRRGRPLRAAAHRRAQLRPARQWSAAA